MTELSETVEQRFGTEIRAEKLQLLYEQSFQAVYFTLTCAILLVIILWPHTSRDILLGWLGALFIASLIRVGLFLSYRNASPTGTEMLAWESPYMVTLMLSACILGVGGLLIIPSDSMLFATVVYYFIMGMAGGAVAVYSASRSLTIATVIVILLPTTLWMLTRGEITPTLMGLGAVLLFIASLRSSKVLSSALHQNFLLTHLFNERKEAAERQARIDALTGLNNRRAFTELSDTAVQMCLRSGQSFASIMLDIDHFKMINDSYGHATGDLALRHVAKLLQHSVRKTDICARIGGEEFAVLLPDSDQEAAMMVAEKVRDTIARQPLETPDGPLLITGSLGVAIGPAELQLLLNLADEAMYQAKQAGRNRVVCQHVPLEHGDLLVASQQGNQGL